MKLIENIKIKGEIFYEYAFLTVEFELEGSKDAKRCEYRFALPDGARMSNVRVHDGQNLISVKVVSSTYAAQIREKKQAATVCRTPSGTYLLSVDGVSKRLKIRLSVYSPLTSVEGENRLVIPVAKFKDSSELCQCAELNLLIHGRGIAAESSTHKLSFSETSFGIRAVSDKFCAERDFCLRIKVPERRNTAICASDGLTSELICKVYPDTDFFEACIAGGKFDFSGIYADAEGADTEIIGLPADVGGAITLYVNCGYDTLPQTVRIQKSGYCTEFIIDDTEVYNSFAPIRLAYADVVEKRLLRKLETCRPDEVRTIRHKIEGLGVKYGVINSETVYLVELGEERSIVRAAEIARLKNVLNAFEEASISAEELAVCKSTVIASMRPDGAICVSGETDPDTRKRQTLVCVLALIASDSVKIDDEYMQAAFEYLKGFSYNDMRCTTDKTEACEILNRRFGRDLPESIGVMPDLYTAAKVVYLAKRQNNKDFNKTLD